MEDHNDIISDLADFTLSTGFYDHLYTEFQERVEKEIQLTLSISEQRKLFFYAGMKASQKLLYPQQLVETSGGYISRKAWDEHCDRIAEDNNQGDKNEG